MKDFTFIPKGLCSIEPGTAMLIAGGIGAGSNILGGLMGGGGSGKIASAMREAVAEQRRQYNETVGRLKPYTEFGGEQLNALSGWLEDPTKQPMSYLDPGYDFRREQAMKSLTGNAATAGMLQSGDTLRAVEQYGQGLASSEYGNAFNRWLGEGGFRQGLAGMGQNAAANLGDIGQRSATNIGNYLSQMGGAQADQARTYGNIISGTGGIINNTLARYLGMQPGGTPGGAPVGSQAWQDPNYLQDWNDPRSWQSMGYSGVPNTPGGSNIFASWDDPGGGGG